MKYSESHLEEGKGKSYQASFTNNAYRNLIWGFERKIIADILEKYFAKAEIKNHLDFACGTGRILCEIQSEAAKSTGIDVSASMLEVAKRDCPTAVLYQVDITKVEMNLEGAFDLISAFRFFPNAEPELRIAVLRKLVGLLGKGGILVFNNHKNTGSARNRLARLAGRHNFKGMSYGEVLEMIEEVGLDIIQMYHTSVFPASDIRPLLPIPLLKGIESLAYRSKSLAAFGENQIYVCTHRDSEFNK